MGDRYLHIPVVNDFGGAPFAEHDQACTVCARNHAILDLTTGIFQPCGECQQRGYRVKLKPRFLPRLIWNLSR